MDKAQDLAGRGAKIEAGNETLRRLLELYCDSAHEQTARLSRLASRADEHTAALIDCWRVMQAATHRIAGTAQSLGLIEFGNLAARIDDKLDAMIAGDIGMSSITADIAELAEECAYLNPKDARPLSEGSLGAAVSNWQRTDGEFALRDAIVIIADDDVIARELLRAILLEEGASQVITVRSGQEALQQAALITPTLVIADWRMTPGSGRELLHLIRSGQSPMLTTTPFVMLTRLQTLGGRRAIIDEGANYFIEKPFTRDRLLCAVRAAMGFSANDTNSAPPPRLVGSAA